MPTIKELANGGNNYEKHAFIIDPRRAPRELLEYVKEAPAIGHDSHLATQALNVRISEIADDSTRRLVNLTWAIVALTVALVGLTIYLSYQAYDDSKSRQTAAPHTSQKP